MKHFFVEGEIECLTGLHIGMGGGSIEIGGIDDPIVRNPLTDFPYVPGSSLKGKMRSLLEKEKEPDLEKFVRSKLQEKLQAESDNDKKTQLQKELKKERLAFNREHEKIGRHECDTSEWAKDCPVCRLFGSTGKTGNDKNYPARLLVRDGGLTVENSIIKDGMKVTEAKMEHTLDRVTSAAVPRTIERVPATVKFNLNLVYRVDEKYQKEDLKNILFCLKLVEKDGLGGNISRGYGQVKFSIKRFQLEGEEGWLPEDGTKRYSYAECENKINENIK